MSVPEGALGRRRKGRQVGLRAKREGESAPSECMQLPSPSTRSFDFCLHDSLLSYTPSFTRHLPQPSQPLASSLLLPPSLSQLPVMPPRAVARSPSPDASTDDIPPLAFDTEDELLAVFARLRDDLLKRVGDKWEQEGASTAKGKGKGVDKSKVEDIVLKVSTVEVHWTTEQGRRAGGGQRVE